MSDLLWNHPCQNKINDIDKPPLMIPQETDRNTMQVYLRFEIAFFQLIIVKFIDNKPNFQNTHVFGISNISQINTKKG